MSWNPLRTLVVVLTPAVLVVVGCGGRVAAVNGQSVASLFIHADAVRIDTNGQVQYSATLGNGQLVQVKWSITGGDARAGAGTITEDGLYTPPKYLTEDSASVVINAVANTGINSGVDGKKSPADLLSDSVELMVTPGFLQPLTPGNLSLGAGGIATISSSITEVGGNGGVRFTLASDAAGTPGGAGSLSTPHCERGAVAGPNPAYTVCTVKYTAPAILPASGSVFVVGAVAASSSSNSNSRLSWTRILLNSAGVSSDPVAHQAHLAWPVMLGSSSGNNADYDAAQGLLSDCCGGTLGALLQDTSGNQYVLSNNHVLARSDQSFAGETIIQPGLIDNGCTPYGYGPGTTAVATLTGYPALNSAGTNVDAAIARVTPGAVDTKGNILELGAKQADGSLAAAPPGISSTGGKGEAPQLGMTVAKSGRTTGLTCAAVSAVNVDVVVDYFTDCAETAHAFAKTFTNQIVMSGTSFSDAGDSGALVVDTANAEPVGLFFAGGTDQNGVEQAIASPASEVLSALDTQVRGTNGATNYSFVGGADHPVSCLNYGGLKAADANAAVPVSAASLSQVLAVKQRNVAALMKSNSAIFGVGVGQSLEHPGEAAVMLFVDRKKLVGRLPDSIEGQRIRVVLMDRLHVTRAHGTPAQRNGRCLSRQEDGGEWRFEDQIKLQD